MTRIPITSTLRSSVLTHSIPSAVRASLIASPPSRLDVCPAPRVTASGYCLTLRASSFIPSIQLRTQYYSSPSGPRPLPATLIGSTWGPGQVAPSDEVEVYMIDTLARGGSVIDDEPIPRFVDSLLLGDLLCGEVESAYDLGIGLLSLSDGRDLLSWYDEDMGRCRGVDIPACDQVIGLVDYLCR